MYNDFIQISEEVKVALNEKKPVVALESTIISHGMPWPKNAETALSVEKAVRDNGAIPATIAILDGKCLVGLTERHIEMLGNGGNVWKVSLRDMPYVLSQNIAGATTVAATMRIASMVGVPFFATGGIGGVHRGASQTMDISADLTEMAQTNVAVVSAGIKSILDIGLTLEYLETVGVPVITYRQKIFPSFYSSESAFQSPMMLNSCNDIAKLLKMKWDMNLNGSVLIANPLPEGEGVDHQVIETHIIEALQEAEKKQIRGKDITPFLLRLIAEKTGGDSLKANISLIHHNARLAAGIAVEFSNLRLH